MSGRLWNNVGKLAVLLTLLCAPVSAARLARTNPLSPTKAAVIAGWQSPVTVALAAVVPGQSAGQPFFAQLMHRSNSALLGMQLAIALWIFILGACFGSFLNVVIYRLPAGMSLGRPKSRCPGCETPLSARDNVPVLGWLMLRGKCRYCGMPIAVRYPLIELTCGLVLLALMFGELLTGAANLPVRHPDHFSLHSGFWLAWFAKWDLSGIYAYHCCLVIVSLATLMIGYDGHRPQRRLMLFGLLVGLVAGTMWLELRPVAALPWPDLFYQYRFGFTWGDLSAGGDSYWTGVTLVGLLDGLTGMLTAYCAGRGLQFAVGHRDAPATASVGMAICAMLTLSGAYLGWQGAVMLAIVCLPVVAVGRIGGLIFPSAIRLLAPTVFVLLPGFVLGWAYLDQISWMIGIDGFADSGLVWWQDWLIALSVLAVACGAVGLVPAVSNEDMAAVNSSVATASCVELNAVSVASGGVVPATTPLPQSQSAAGLNEQPTAESDAVGQSQPDIPGGSQSDLPDGDERLPSGES